MATPSILSDLHPFGVDDVAFEFAPQDKIFLSVGMT